MTNKEKNKEFLERLRTGKDKRTMIEKFKESVDSYIFEIFCPGWLSKLFKFILGIICFFGFLVFIAFLLPSDEQRIYDIFLGISIALVIGITIFTIKEMFKK